MAASPFGRLDTMIEAADLLSLELDPDRSRANLRLAVPIGSDPDNAWRERALVLHGVTRVTAWLRRGQHSPGSGLSRDYPTERVAGLRELNGWLHRWSGSPLSGQPGPIFDAGDGPAWPGRASLDLVGPGHGERREVHTLDLRLPGNPRLGGRMLDLRVEFDDIELVRPADGAAATGPRPPARGSGSRRPAARGPQQGARRRVSAQVRRRRAVAALTILSLALVAWLVIRLTTAAGPHKPVADARAGASAQAAAQRKLPAAESGLLPWHLAVPVSRETVVPGPGGQLVVIGGLTAAGRSANGVYAIRPATGAAQAIGVLKVPIHDAATAVLGRRTLVYGGGSPATVATVQALTVGSRGGASPTATATVAGAMPTPRSDAAAVSIGQTTYVVGGYTGARPDAQVLATSNGRTFTTVAKLPIPVRYPATAVLGGKIYVFGGQAIAGPQAGEPVNTIQAVDPARHAAVVIGHLPEPLAGATAVTLGGEVFVAGGQSTTAQPLTPGLGTTQLGSASPASPAADSPGHTATVSTIWAFDPATRRLLSAGRLQVPVSHAGVAVVGTTAWIVGGESNGTVISAVQMLRPDRAFGTAGAPGAGSPYFGYRLLVADRGNNRLLLLNAQMHVVWKYPSAHSPKDRLGFYFPDDAFFVDHGTEIISNQEQNETIVKIAYPSGKIVWSYGHPGHAGTAPGFLHEPDDAYLLRNGQISVADAQNCRVLVINPNHTVAHQIGENGVCAHNPPTSLGSPNGDTPLADGNLLISEINGSWVSEYTLTGRLVWTTHLPISYPSDPQQLGPDRYLIADYTIPGEILEFNRQGQITYRYQVTSGPGMLNHPSLAEMLPSGVLMANDDYNDRMVAIDPRTGALVWQYGVTGQPGTAPGRLRLPDGFDLLAPNGSTPTHRATG